MYNLCKMKRLLAYLFIVLGLGLMFSVNANATGDRFICVKEGRYVKTNYTFRKNAAEVKDSTKCDYFIYENADKKYWKIFHDVFSIEKNKFYQIVGNDLNLNSALARSFLCVRETKLVKTKYYIEILTKRNNNLKCEHEIYYSKNKGNWRKLHEVEVIDKNKFYQIAGIKEKTQIAKKEPSQTQEVAKGNPFCIFRTVGQENFIFFPLSERAVNEFESFVKKYTWANIPGIKKINLKDRDDILNFCHLKIYESSYPFQYNELLKYWMKIGGAKGSNSIYKKTLAKYLGNTMYAKLTKDDETQIAKKEPKKKKKESSTKVAKLTDGKKIIRKKIKIDQNNRKVEKISAWEKSVLAALEDEKDDPYCELRDKKPSLEDILNLKKKEKLKFKLNFCLKKSDLLMLGKYKKIELPKIIFNTLKGCKSNACIRKKSGQNVYKLFVQKGSRYHARHPGDMIKGMVWFEIMYLDRLKKGSKAIERYSLGKYDQGLDQFKKEQDPKTIYSLIKINKGRIKMRKALGYTLYDDLNYVIEGQWLLAEFLNKDKLKVTKVALTAEMKKRKFLIEKYKSVLARYKAKFEEEKEKKDKKNDKKS